jgi:hypothetical protein
VVFTGAVVFIQHFFTRESNKIIESIDFTDNFHLKFSEYFLLNFKSVVPGRNGGKVVSK